MTVIDYTKAVTDVDRALYGDAAMRRGDAVAREALDRWAKAKSKAERIKAAIDYVVAFQKMAEEACDPERTAKEIIALVASDTPLDCEGRHDLGRVLQRLLFPELIDPRRRRIADRSYDIAWEETLKDHLRAMADLPACEAEQEVAGYLGISVEALRKKRVRARQEERKARARQTRRK
jgi:hypothetical protein